MNTSVRHRRRYALLSTLSTLLFVGALLRGCPQAHAQAPLPAATPPGTFTNPIRQRAPDPWIVYHDGNYYLTSTVGWGVAVRKAPTLAGLGEAKDVAVWRGGGPGFEGYTRDVWAPELHSLNGKWYIYYCATDGPDGNRRIFALEGQTADPLGAYTFKGKVAAPGADFYAIDPSVFQKADGSLYLLWSGHAGPGGGPQNIYIAPLSDPWTISGPRVQLSTPEFDWEKHGWRVNEGPEALTHNGTTYVTYSGSGYTTPDYSLGLLTNKSGDLLNATAWTKSPLPVLSRYQGPDGLVSGPGHNGFFKSPDGKEDWVVFHGRLVDEGRAPRHAFAERISWATDGTPEFEHPVPPGVPLAVPSGESDSVPESRGTGTGLLGQYFNDSRLIQPVLTRKDPDLNFNWLLGAPAPSLHPDFFSARWTGQVQPRYTETYTFQTYADDGVRVWVDGKKIIDDWTNHLPTTDQGQIALQAGRKYDIRIEYYEYNHGARLTLAWSSPHQPFEPIPTDRLYAPTKGVR